MVRDLSETYRAEHVERPHGADRRFQLVLWFFWTLAVVGTAVFNWQADVAAQRPVNMLGLVIYTVLSGVVGLVVMTVLELWLEPQRFID